MNYYIFKDQIFTIFLSLAHLSAVSFETKINDYVGGEIGDFKIYELNKGKSLVYEAKRDSINKNFIVFSKGGKYHFNLKTQSGMSDKDIEIKEARECELFNLFFETAEFKLFECPRSLFIMNKKKDPLKVNEFIVSDKKFISKGPPLWINGKLVYYKGVLR